MCDITSFMIQNTNNDSNNKIDLDQDLKYYNRNSTNTSIKQYVKKEYIGECAENIIHDTNNIDNIDINTQIKILNRLTIKQLREWLQDNNIHLKTYFLPKNELIKKIKEVISIDYSPKYLDMPKVCIYRLGLVLDPKSICMLASTCRRMYEVLSTNLIWYKHCQDIDYFHTLTDDVQNNPKSNGFWKRWYNNHIPISISLQKPDIVKWRISKDVEKDVVVPRIGSIVYKMVTVTDIDDPNGDAITLNIKYVCTKVEYFARGYNKGIVKSFTIARNCDKRYKLKKGVDKVYMFTLNTQQEHVITANGNIPINMTIIDNDEYYN